MEDRGRITKQSSVFPVSRCPLSTLERECFQLATKCIIAVDRSSFRSVGSLFHARGATTEKALVVDSSTCPRHDEVARRRSTQCRSSWHVGDRCQQVSDVFWRVYLQKQRLVLGACTSEHYNLSWIVSATGPVQQSESRGHTVVPLKIQNRLNKTRRVFRCQWSNIWTRSCNWTRSWKNLDRQSEHG